LVQIKYQSNQMGFIEQHC